MIHDYQTHGNTTPSMWVRCLASFYGKGLPHKIDSLLTIKKLKCVNKILGYLPVGIGSNFVVCGLLSVEIIWLNMINCSMHG